MNIVIRADASTQIGTGHLMRCLALAQAWQESGGVVHFVCADIVPALETRLQKDGIRPICLDVVAGTENDMTRTVALARETKADWVVLDGYHFGSAYQKAIKQAELRLLCIDDYRHAGHYFADLVLNQNIFAEEALYESREPYTGLLLGTQFVLLRQEFWSWRGWKRTIPDVVKKVLVTIGGSDTDNVTQRVVNTLMCLDNTSFEVQIVVGPGNQNLPALRNALSTAPRSMRLLTDVADMPELMAWADVAISAGGSTCWELAFMGLPSVVFAIASNQDRIAAGLGRIGAAININYPEQWDTALIAAMKELDTDGVRRQKISNQACKLVDGYGASRVISAMVD